MKHELRSVASMTAVMVAGVMGLFVIGGTSRFTESARAQSTATPIPEGTTAFDQAAAIGRLRAQITGKEQEPSETVFKNIQSPALRGVPAGRLVAIMEMGYARSLGVNCTHCHVPDRWEAEDKPQKQIAREMAAMTGRINTEMLHDVKNLRSATPTINCTTCHRGDIRPALNLPQK